jgi:hypothetical protein
MTRRSLNRRVADLVLVSDDTDRLVREGPMSSFDIDVTRDGGWWMVYIPKLGERTQARYPREVELMAREYIAISTRNAYRPGGYQLASPHTVSWGRLATSTSLSR